MKLSDFDYYLPPELIAQEPASPRDRSRLLCFRRRPQAAVEHRYFSDIIDYLDKGDVLVMNNSKVFPARLWAAKDTGGKLEVLLNRRKTSGPKGETWQALIGGRGARTGRILHFKGRELKAAIAGDNEDGTWDLKFNMSGNSLMEAIEQIGEVPLPPYIVKSRSFGKLRTEKHKAENKEKDKNNYQTVYADDEKPGSVAAPTAGLHFTPGLIERLKKKGVKIEYLTLHVGLGTFAPVKVADITRHKMHAEYAEIKKSTIKNINEAKKNKRRIIAVGTTSARTLESFYSNPTAYRLLPTAYSAWVDIFIYPGYEFKVIDGLITNFHLPKSTLLMLVSALAGRENIQKTYKIAVKAQYRFYSYGDAMLII